LTIGYHAPPPGAPTGVADYAETLLAALRSSAPPGIAIERNAASADVHLYHLGNNRLHAEIYSRAISTPGIVIVHDAVLHHFLLGALSPAQYADEFVFNYGEWSRHIAEELWRDRAASGVDPRYFQYPMLRRAVENARAVIVHNPGAAEIARAHGARSIHVIPHFFEARDIPDAFATERFRQRLGIAAGVTIYGIFGYLRETKRVNACIAAFRRLNAARPNTALLIAGDAVSDDLGRLVAAAPIHPAIHRLGHLSDSDFRVAAAAVDCCLNLRYPAAGETSGIAIRLMGFGKPVIVTEGPEAADFPATACLRVPSGSDEASVLFDQMAFVAEFPRLAAQIGDEAARHVRTCHALGNVASRYWQVIESVTAFPTGLTSTP
jgi:glycosyltransferase involved in cell wall biosynthesis